MNSMYALIDCNNFFVSCERVANPQLHNRAVVVLSNNGGCVVSRSNEAKQLGIPMGEPFFKLRDIVREHNVVALRANFALYGELSERVMSTITDYFPEVAIYSIDEAFVDLALFKQNYDVAKLCIDLGQKIATDTGIPVSIGIAPTMTLSKVANHMAKITNAPQRVFNLDSPQKTQQILADFAVREVWGIGRGIHKKLNSMGVNTVGALLQLPATVLQANFSTMLQRTVLELQGIACIELRASTANKQIMVSRSFEYRVTNLPQLQEALAAYAGKACEKLRSQGSVTGGIYVILRTGLYGSPETIYKNSVYVKLPHRTADTRMIIKFGKNALAQLFRSGFRYQKVGIILCDIVPVTQLQMDLFGHADLQHSDELMHLIDTINHKFGKTTVQLAATNIKK